MYFIIFNKLEVGEILGWYKRNLGIAIPISIIVIGGIFIIIWTGISRCRGYARRDHSRNSQRASLRSRSSQLAPNNKNLPSAPNSAHTFETHELQTFRNNSGSSHYPGNIRNDWSELEPFQFNTTNEFTPLTQPQEPFRDIDFEGHRQGSQVGQVGSRQGSYQGSYQT